MFTISTISANRGRARNLLRGKRGVLETEVHGHDKGSGAN